MSDPSAYDPNWWRAARALSLERREREAEAAATALAGDSFLIVTEGVVTEVCYFEQLRAALQLSAVKVVVEPGDASEARHVIETAARLAQEQRDRAARGQLAMDEPSSYDQVWAVLDTDVSERHRRWPDILTLAAQRGVRLASSTPCFEYWLLLHLAHTTAPLANGTAAKARLADELGDYSTNEAASQAALKKILPAWPTAVKRAEQARQYHLDACTASPANPSTEVDRLATALNCSAPVHARKIHPSVN